MAETNSLAPTNSQINFATKNNSISSNYHPKISDGPLNLRQQFSAADGERIDLRGLGVGRAEEMMFG